MVSVLAPNAVDRRFERRSDQTKDYKNWYMLIFDKHLSIKSKSKDVLALNKDNVSEWSDMFSRSLLQWASTINPTKLVGLI